MYLKNFVSFSTVLLELFELVKLPVAVEEERKYFASKISKIHTKKEQERILQELEISGKKHDFSSLDKKRHLQTNRIRIYQEAITIIGLKNFPMLQLVQKLINI